MTMTPEFPVDAASAARAAQNGATPPPGAGAALVDAMPALVVITDATGVFQFISDAYRRYTGLTLEEARDWERHQVIHPDDYPQAMERWGHALSTGDPLVSDMRLLRADGTYRWHRVSGLPIRDADQGINRWITVSIDIDDARRAEDALQVTAEQYRMLAEALPAVLLTASPEGELTYANRLWYDYTGLPAATPLDDGWLRVVHPDDLERIRRGWDVARASGEPFDDGYRIRRADGAYHWHFARTVPVRDSDGAVVLWIATLGDVDDRKRAEERERFLSNASARLATSLDYDSTLDAITSLAVPEIADWCGVFAANGTELIRRVANEYDDWRREGAEGAAPDGPSPGIARVLETGEPWLNADLSADALRARGVPEHFIESTLRAGFRSSMLLPLKSRARTIGVVVFCTVGERTYDELDLRVATEFAARVSAALDNATLYRETRSAQLAQEEAHALLDTIVSAAPVGLGFVDRDLRMVRINQTLADMNGVSVEQSLGRRVADIIPDLWPQLEPMYQRVLDHGEAITDMQMSGETPAAPGRARSWLVNMYPVRVDAEIKGIGMIVSDVTDERERQEQQRLSELRYRTLANALPELVWTARADGIVDYFNERWFEYTGTRPSHEGGWRWRSVVHPDDLPEVTGRWERSLESGEDFIAEARLRRADGAYCWHIVRAIALTGIDGSVLAWFGNCADVDDRKRQEDELKLSALRYRTLVESLPEMIWTTDAEGRVEFRSDNWFTYTGARREDMTEAGWQELVHPDDREETSRSWNAALATGAPYEAEFRLRRGDGAYRWHFVRGRALPATNGSGIAGWSGTLTDIDDRKREEVRSEFLAHASNILSSSLDYQATLLSVARLAVPEIGDWCAVDVLQDGRLDRLAVVHVDPAKVQWAYDIEKKYPVNPEDPRGTYEVVRTGVSQFFPVIPEELLVEAAIDEEHLQLIRDIGFTAAMTVPMVSAGQTLGVISFVTAESNRPYDLNDLALAEEVGRRAGNAVANARLYTAEREAREVAEATSVRIALLAETGEILGASLNYDKNLRELAQLMVPALADWCTLDVLEEGTLRRLAITNADAEQAERLRAFDGRYGLDLETGQGSAAVVRTGEPIHIEHVTDAMLAASAADEEQLQLLRYAEIISYTSVPLTARGRTLGAMTLFTLRGESGRRLSKADFALASEIARRAAIAIDNARLFGDAQRTAAELRVANQAKDEFLGLVSHELRTPITTIFGNAQVLHYRGGGLDAETREQAIADIEQESERLHRIIDNMLVLSRLEAGREIETEPVVVGRMIDRIVASFTQRKAHRVVEIDTEPGLEPASAEPVYFEQVLRNLLSNADKYSPADLPVTVRARRDGDFVTVSVLDRGRGVAGEDIDKIFKAFYRSPHTSAQASGAGIGLAVCKRLIEAQGGRIWARPRDGGGAEFGFTLPLEQEKKA